MCPFLLTPSYQPDYDKAYKVTSILFNYHVQGLPGDRGVNGLPGLGGSRGEIGLPGEPGPRGPSGTRVRGNLQ